MAFFLSSFQGEERNIWKKNGINSNFFFVRKTRTRSRTCYVFGTKVRLALQYGDNSEYSLKWGVLTTQRQLFCSYKTNKNNILDMTKLSTKTKHANMKPGFRFYDNPIHFFWHFNICKLCTKDFLVVTTFLIWDWHINIEALRTSIVN